jgi:hypothetical protein
MFESDEIREQRLIGIKAAFLIAGAVAALGACVWAIVGMM